MSSFCPISIYPLSVENRCPLSCRYRAWQEVSLRLAWKPPSCIERPQEGLPAAFSSPRSTAPAVGVVASVVSVFYHQPLHSYECGFFSKSHSSCRREPQLPLVDTASERGTPTSEAKANFEKERKLSEIATEIEELATEWNLVK